MEYASNGKGNLGVTLGSIGTGLSILNGGLGLLSGNTGLSSNYVTKETFDMAQALASKDSEIALLKADQASEVKMTEVYKQAHAEVAALRTEMASEVKDLRKDLNDFERDNAIAHTQMSDSISVLSNSVATVNQVLSQITMTKIPNTAVCPGWGNVTITPATAASGG